MSLLIPPGHVQASFRFALVGDAEEMHTTVGYATGAGGATGTALADLLADKFLAAYPAGKIYNSWTFRGVTIYVGQDGGPPAVFESSPSKVRIGTAAGSTVPNNSAAVVRKMTDLAGRRGRGRLFIPPFFLGKDSVDGRGYIYQAEIAAFQADIAAWFSGAAWRLLHSTGLSAAPAPTPISSFVLQPQIGTQRRRMRP
jgi:hypothetical protein